MSKDGPEVTRGGSRVYRHQEVADGKRVEHGDEATIEAITAHMEQHLGPVENVWHELVSDRVHIDVHVIPPNGEHDSITLFTTGMSDLPMTVDPAVEGAPIYAELLLRLPVGWKLDQASFSDEAWYWPVRWLKTLARLPHQYATWLGWGHTIPNGDPAERLAPNVPFTGFVVAPPTCLDEEASVITTPTRQTTIFAIYPLHPDEMTYKLERGSDALFDLMDAAGVIDRVDPKRPSVVPKRGKRR